MKLTDINKVIHLDNLNDVNKYLKDGWKIINTYTIVPDEAYPKHEMLIYSLGTIVNPQTAYESLDY